MIDRKGLMRKMYSAISKGDSTIVLRLVEDNPDLLQVENPFGSWLHVAAEAGKIKIVELLISLGVDINYSGGISGGNSLNIASIEGNLDIVKYLISKGAEFDIREPERNPLFGAIQYGHIDVVRVLINAGINTTVTYTGQYMKDMDALAFAREWGKEDIVNVLSELSA